jgi:enoyl-CoA hydratase/carnithine racemase
VSDVVITERQGHVLLIGLNRPDKLNAFDPHLIEQLSAAYTELAEDRELRCGVLWAEGRYFTSGLDLGSLVKRVPQEVAASVLRPIPLPFEIVKSLIPRGNVDPWGVTSDPCPKPIVTAVHGRCFTLGIELLLTAQVNIAGEEATFTQYEVSRGMLPFGGGTVRWPLAAGTHNAYRYMLTGDEFDAAEARRIGLVQHVVPTEQCRPTAVEIAEKIAAQAPLGVQAVLASVRNAESKGASAELGRIHRRLARLLLSKDLRRGFTAFKERRPAEFKGN